jgi:hypothetical protein
VRPIRKPRAIRQARRRAEAFHLAGIHRKPARWPRDLDLRRTRQGRNHAPAFRNTVRMLARLYDALHDEKEERPVLPRPTPAAGATPTNFSRPRATWKKWWARATPSRNGRA